MHELHSNLLWIGNALDARNPKQLIDHGINAVVDVAYEETPAQLPRQMIYCRFPLNDGGGNDVRLVVHTLQTSISLLQNNIPTVIACSAGMSRSPTIAAFTLALLKNDDPKHCIAEIGTIRSLELKSQLWAEVDEAFKSIKAGIDA